MSKPIIDQSSASGIATAMASNPYFTTEAKQVNIGGLTSSSYVVLRPKNGSSSVVDVYRSMAWSNLGKKDEVPQVFVTEKELQYGAWATQISNLIEQGANLYNNGRVDSFVQLYAAKNTGFYYNFPWLLKNGDNIRSIENSWNSIQGLGDFLSSSAKSSDSTAGKIFGAAVGISTGLFTPGFGFEDTKQYESTSQQQLTITFPLYNTIDLELAFKHFSFVNLFTFQNLKTRTTLMSFIPPKIYEVDAYSVGGIYMAAAVVSNFKVDSIGTTRRMSEWTQFGPREILIPEAYRVTITFTDLLSQSSNVFAGALGGNKIQVTNAGAPIAAAADTITNFAEENLPTLAVNTTGGGVPPLSFGPGLGGTQAA
jgi:hypothetical protein